MSESRTLIIDDEETYARALQRLLGRRGIEADVATTAAEGLLRARRTAYTLVVLDYLLPDGTGLDLLHRMEAAGRGDTLYDMDTALADTLTRWRRHLHAQGLDVRQLRTAGGAVGGGASLPAKGCRAAHQQDLARTARDHGSGP